MSKGMGLIIKDALQPYSKHYDYVLIDCPPTLGISMINALAACEKLIIPVQTEFLALKGLERILNTLKMISSSGRGRLEYVVVPTMFDRRTRASIESLNKLQEEHQHSLWQGHIPFDTKFRDASSKRKLVSYIYPESHGVRAYRSLLKFLMTDSVDIMDVMSDFPQSA
jgi:chromosome partitioning protein